MNRATPPWSPSRRRSRALATAAASFALLHQADWAPRNFREERKPRRPRERCELARDLSGFAPQTCREQCASRRRCAREHAEACVQRRAELPDARGAAPPPSCKPTTPQTAARPDHRARWSACRARRERVRARPRPAEPDDDPPGVWARVPRVARLAGLHERELGRHRLAQHEPAGALEARDAFRVVSGVDAGVNPANPSAWAGLRWR